MVIHFVARCQTAADHAEYAEYAEYAEHAEWAEAAETRGSGSQVQRVRIVSRSKRAMLRKMSTTQTAAIPKHSASRIGVVMKKAPAIWPSSMPISGRTTRTATCCALRGSFTRDDTAIVACSAARDANGPSTPTRSRL